MLDTPRLGHAKGRRFAPPERGSKCRTPAVCAAALLLLAGCGGEPARDRVLLELERMSFVVPGRCEYFGPPRVAIPVGEFTGPRPIASTPVEIGPQPVVSITPTGPVSYENLHGDLFVSVPLLVDRFEATRDDWRYHMGEPPRALGLLDPSAETTPDRLAWPAFCNLGEAREFAERRGMRLLTAGEWMYVAAGSSFQRYPWGRDRRTSVANTLELGLQRPVAVGTFERGRSGSGCYDLVGNVMEWVEESLPPSISLVWSDASAPSAMGGSYLLGLQPLQSQIGSGPNASTLFASVPLPPGSRSVDLGVRCAVEAERYLATKLRLVSRSTESLQRLERIGSLWGRPSLPLLERLLAAKPGDPALAALARGASR